MKEIETAITTGDSAKSRKIPAPAQAGSEFTGYQKFVVLLLTLLQFTIVLDFMILSPLGDILMKSLSMSPKQFGSVVSAYAISAGMHMKDRGAYMSVNSSLQQMAGGFAAMLAGLVVVQPNQAGPLKNFHLLGFAMMGIILVSIVLMYRVSELVKGAQSKQRKSE